MKTSWVKPEHFLTGGLGRFIAWNRTEGRKMQDQKPQPKRPHGRKRNRQGA